MYLSSSSPTGIRFLASIKQGNGLKPSARAAGINKEIGYRWLRESYLRFRSEGLGPAEASEALGFTTSRLPTWEAAVGVDTGRHHRQTNVRDEALFWAAFERGSRVDRAAQIAGVNRSTAYRWIRSRFDELRESKTTQKRCQVLLRLTDRHCQGLERERLARLAKERNTATAAQRPAAGVLVLRAGCGGRAACHGGGRGRCSYRQVPALYCDEHCDKRTSTTQGEHAPWSPRTTRRNDTPTKTGPGQGCLHGKHGSTCGSS